MPEATFAPPDQTYEGGWTLQYDENGNPLEYWRYTTVDPKRGPNQTGTYDNFAMEVVPASKFNSGNFKPDAVEYRTGGTNVQQNDPRGWGVLSTVGPIALALMAGGAGAEQFGLFGPGGFNGMTGLGEVTGLGGAMAPSDALLMAGGEPIAGSGFSLASSGAPSFGQAFLPGATLAQAGEAAGSILGLPNMVGVPGAIAGGALSLGSLPSELGNAVIPGVNAPSPAPGQPGGPTSPGPTPEPTTQNPAPPPTDVKKPGDSGFQWPTDPAGWLKLFGPALGGLLLGAESYLNKGDEQPQDPFTRDYARGVLSNPRASAGAMSGLMNKKYY